MVKCRQAQMEFQQAQKESDQAAIETSNHNQKNHDLEQQISTVESKSQDLRETTDILKSFAFFHRIVVIRAALMALYASLLFGPPISSRAHSAQALAHVALPSAWSSHQREAFLTIMDSGIVEVLTVERHKRSHTFTAAELSNAIKLGPDGPITDILIDGFGREFETVCGIPSGEVRCMCKVTRVLTSVLTTDIDFASFSGSEPYRCSGSSSRGIRGVVVPPKQGPRLALRR